ncbi:RNA-binding transcriptional accessory protein [Candidatus Heimdallarchaeota archaeon B3_Heim]|nr:MAG: RNA-binding transcriptional accessory protein [Candidatus Heimdallarchaeota archaeon B3_Heim]
MISSSLQLTQKQVSSTLELLNDGNTVPFIARYRKEKTQSLDETQIRAIEENYQELTQLHRERKRIHKVIEAQGQMTEELASSIANATSLAELKEIYLPYKRKKKTKGMVAREKGLEPLANILFGKDDYPEGKSLLEIADGYVDSELGVGTPEEALEGARHIIAEDLSISKGVRDLVRHSYFSKALFTTKKSLLYEMDEEEQENSQKVIQGKKYEQYFAFEEPALSVPPHRLLAMLRGDREGILSFKVAFPDENIIEKITKDISSSININTEISEQLDVAIRDSWKRLLGPSLQRELKRIQFEKAQQHSIQVFGENLKHLLLSPPIQSRILGIDPAFRTGCKYAAIDEMGNVLANGTVYPTKPHEQFEKSAQVLKGIIEKHKISIIAIGNGTASRETEEFVSKYIAKATDLKYVIVNEAGASVYSASDIAREEFPDVDVSIRGAVSIARRLQDPLAELVKIDPRSIGVGQYQHDLFGLSKALKDVVVDTVNLVGADVNTASEVLLKYVSGITKSVAKNIINYRKENGAFVYREDLKGVPGIGPRTFEQSVGFLRIPDAPDPFDNSPIHPESYELAESIIKLAKFTKEDLSTKDRRVRLQRQLKLLNPTFAAKQLHQEDFLVTITDIIEILQNPYRDPRDDFDKPILKSSVLTIEDLEVGSIIEGTVTNVTDFGCFVDLGVKTNGLIHISEISDSFIRHPREAGLKVGDIVKPRVKDIDLVKKRISLSLKKELSKAKDRFKRSPKRRGSSTKPVKKSKPRTLEDQKIDSLFKNGRIQL